LPQLHVHARQNTNWRDSLKTQNDRIPFDYVHVRDPFTGIIGKDPVTLKSLLMSTNLKLQTIELIAESPKPVVQIVGSGKPVKSLRSNEVHPKNERIPFKNVFVIDSETNKVLEREIPLQNLLASVDRSVYFIQLVAREPRPLVRIVAQSEDYLKRKLKRKTKAKTVDTKEVQCTWSLASGDLRHKMERVRAHTMKGDRVNVVFTPKHKVPVPPPRIRDQLLDEALSYVREDCKEAQPRTVEGLRVTLHLEAVEEC